VEPLPQNGDCLSLSLFSYCVSVAEAVPHLMVSLMVGA
jgi:hypothetical protein